MLDAVAIDDPPDRGDGSGLSWKRVGQFADNPDIEFLAQPLSREGSTTMPEGISRGRGLFVPACRASVGSTWRILHKSRLIGKSSDFKVAIGEIVITHVSQDECDRRLSR
ncbi:hypothetical protein NKH19_23245 [Mesorhizobium sp. M1338]|uniref:hypothetical protein n=1 Tax=unclassified Mesorhizobium TaxID=325217 RepID=UPI003339168C